MPYVCSLSCRQYATLRMGEQGKGASSLDMRSEMHQEVLQPAAAATRGHKEAPRGPWCTKSTHTYTHVTVSNSNACYLTVFIGLTGHINQQ